MGIAGGLAFVLLNAGPLPVAGAWRVGAVVASLVVVAVLVVRRDRTPAPVEPSPRALTVYLVSVVAMVVAIRVGTAALEAAERPGLSLPWIVAVVGLHFLPFAAAFGAPVFRWLGVALVAVAGLGALAVLAGAEHADAAAAVAAGFALLAAAVTPALVPRDPRRPDHDAALLRRHGPNP